MQQVKPPINLQVADIDELKATVAPWNLEMTQLGKGCFNGRFRVANVDGVLVSLEHWSKPVLAVGTTPPGYFAVAITYPRDRFIWSGQEASRDEAVWSLGNREIEFLTGEDDWHIAMLFPEEIIEAALGTAIENRIPEQRGVNGIGDQQRGRLYKLISAFLGRGGSSGKGYAGDTQFRDELVYEIVRSMIDVEPPGRRHSLRKSRLTCSRAVRLAKGSEEAPAVTELAVQTGVSQRVLELAFKETLGITPMKFLASLRLQRLYTRLQQSNPDDTTVATLMLRGGFTELGRTAVRFREAFGASPSQILNSPAKHTRIRFSDLLRTS